jgi:hypothetical protein
MMFLTVTWTLIKVWKLGQHCSGRIQKSYVGSHDLIAKVWTLVDDDEMRTFVCREGRIDRL